MQPVNFAKYYVLHDYSNVVPFKIAMLVDRWNVPSIGGMTVKGKPKYPEEY
jgi:hypothetical protein